MSTPKKILFISEELVPYVGESVMSTFCRQLVPPIQESGREVRTFMPKWGIINERRNQLHEVIRLSGMNITVDDVDHQLIIKVASIVAARMQVYFIDNDDFFKKRGLLKDELGANYEDNIERATFYARGVLETVKKLRWTPDVIHCHGFMGVIVPALLREAYKDEPSFRDSTIIYTPSDYDMTEPVPENLEGILAFRSTSMQKAEKKMKAIFKTVSDVIRMAVAYSDGVVLTKEQNDIAAMCDSLHVPHVVVHLNEGFPKEYLAFFDERYAESHPDKPVNPEEDF